MSERMDKYLAAAALRQVAAQIESGKILPETVLRFRSESAGASGAVQETLLLRYTQPKLKAAA